MKHLKFLSLLLLVALFITSCQRDEIEEDFEIKNQSEIQFRSYNQEDCGFINSFCEKQSNILVAVMNPWNHANGLVLLEEEMTEVQ